MKKLIGIILLLFCVGCSNFGMYFSDTKNLPGVGKVQVKKAMYGTNDTCKTYDGTLFTSTYSMRKQNFYKPKKRY